MYKRVNDEFFDSSLAVALNVNCVKNIHVLCPLVNPELDQCCMRFRKDLREHVNLNWSKMPVEVLKIISECLDMYQRMLHVINYINPVFNCSKHPCFTRFVDLIGSEPDVLINTRSLYLGSTVRPPDMEYIQTIQLYYPIVWNTRYWDDDEDQYERVEYIVKNQHRCNWEDCRQVCCILRGTHGDICSECRREYFF